MVGQNDVLFPQPRARDRKRVVQQQRELVTESQQLPPTKEGCGA
jgi:hypothetical protein